MVRKKRKKLIIGFSLLFNVGLAGCGSKATDIPPETKIIPTQSIDEEIKEIATQTTVLITGVRSDSGSGVIVSSQDGKLVILTVKHVIGTPPSLNNTYQIKFNNNNKIYEINSEKYEKAVQVDETLDLAIIELDSKEIYTAAKLSKRLDKNLPVSLSGWRNCSSGSSYDFIKGKILKKLSSESELSKLSKNDDVLYDKNIDYKEGYRVNYTNPSISGMSGGPVLDSDGRLVAIHGKSGHPKATSTSNEDCRPLGPELGNNWGIPIELFLESSLAKDIPLEVDKASPKNLPSASSTNEEIPIPQDRKSSTPIPSPSAEYYDDIFKRPPGTP